MTSHNLPLSNLQESEVFLKTLSKTSDEELLKAKFTFQTFDDHSKRKELARIFHGSLSQHYEVLKKLNEMGAGIFVAINETDLKGRRKENIISIRAYFTDSDNGPIESYPSTPTMIVETPAGEHAYWVLESPDDPILFRGMQKKLSSILKTDPSICDQGRVMRLPGFNHQKSPNNPKLIKIKKLTEETYTHEKLFFKNRSYERKIK